LKKTLPAIDRDTPIRGLAAYGGYPNENDDMRQYSIVCLWHTDSANPLK